MIAVLFPVMSTLRGDELQLRALYLRTIGWSTIICVSMSVGVTLVVPKMVPIVLGAKWLNIEPMMGWLALAAGVSGVSSATYPLFDAIGKPHLGARLQWVRAIMLSLALFPVAYLTHSLVAIAMARLVMVTIFVPTLFFAAGRTIGISPIDYVDVVWRPFVAAAAMAVAVGGFNWLAPLPNAFGLVSDIAIGVLTFGAVITLLWKLSGSPRSAEYDLISQIDQVVRRLVG